LSLAFSANAQIRVGAGLMTGLPMGDWADANGLGIGGGVSCEDMVTDNIGAGLSIGFLSFSSSVETFAGLAEVGPLNMIPIQVFGNYHFMPGEDLNFYAGIGLGYSSISQSTTVFGRSVDISGGGLALVTPRVGVTYMLSDALGVDLNLGYTILNATFEGADEANDLSYIPLNLGVVYVIE
jgi:outer membrane protein W